MLSFVPAPWGAVNRTRSLPGKGLVQCPRGASHHGQSDERRDGELGAAAPRALRRECVTSGGRGKVGIWEDCLQDVTLVEVAGASRVGQERLLRHGGKMGKEQPV